MLIAMVVIFGTCWFPINLINLLADCMELGNLQQHQTFVFYQINLYYAFLAAILFMLFDFLPHLPSNLLYKGKHSINHLKHSSVSGCWSYYYVTFFLCHTIAMSSTCYNPFLYGWLNSAFKAEFARRINSLIQIPPLNLIFKVPLPTLLL